jgi:hypothetical protein
MSAEEFRATNSNALNEHHDFMFGSSGVDVIGIQPGRCEKKILKAGIWVLLRASQSQGIVLRDTRTVFHSRMASISQPAEIFRSAPAMKLQSITA